MKKKLQILAICILTCFIANAQTSSHSNSNFTAAIGIKAALPVGDFNETHSFGVGGDLQGEYIFNPQFSLAFSGGYTEFFGKTITIFGVSGKVSNVGLIPILAGARFYPSSNFFVGAKIGVGVLTGGGSSTSAFDYYPHIGINTNDAQIVFGYNGLTKNGSTLNHLEFSIFFKLSHSK